MRCLKITLAYDGTDYVGWQWQENGRSIQQVFEQAWREVTGEERRATASGRTDAGVHALGQVVSMTTTNELPDETLLRALNANLPRDVVVLEVAAVPEGFHAIRDATGKRYRYVMQPGRIPDVLARRYCWFVPHELNADSMGAAAEHLLGRHDFASFQTAGADRKSTIRTVTDVQLRRAAGPLLEQIVFEIAADGFLYNMVRAIVGTLVEIGRGAQPPSWMEDVIQASSRKLAGPTAPPQGLFLVRVDYE